MTVFLIIGAVGLLLILASLVLGDLLEGIFSIDLDGGGVLSTPVIGSFLAAFGFGGALILYSTSAGAAVSALGGLATGVLFGGVAYAITRSLMNMSTDETPRTTNLVGTTGTVVTQIPDGGLGEINVTSHGQLIKLSARSSSALAAGTEVTVTSVTSPTSVVVEPTTAEAN